MASTFRRQRAAAATTDSSSNSPSPASAAASSSSSSSSTASASSSSLLLRGTKPWTGGVTLTSTGLRDWDQLLLLLLRSGGGGSAGGQPLGTCFGIEEDRWTNSLALALVQYWCAEGISQGHPLLIPIDEDDDDDDDDANNNDKANAPLSSSRWGNEEEEVDDEDKDSMSLRGATSHDAILALLHSLPRNLNWDKQKEKQAAVAAGNKNDTPGILSTSSSSQQQRQPMDILAEEEDEDAEEDEEERVGGAVIDEDDGLKIAWQYRASVQRQRLGVHHHQDAQPGATRTDKGKKGNVFCHSYDLRGRLMDQIDYDDDGASSLLVTTVATSCRGEDCGTTRQDPRMCGIRHYRRIKAKLDAILLQSPGTVVRLLLFRPLVRILNVSLPLLLNYIRENQLPVILLVSTQPWATATGRNPRADEWSRSLLRRLCDVVFEVEGFASRRVNYPPPAEFAQFQGLLKIVKTNAAAATTAHGGGYFANITQSKRPAADLYGIKRDRRKLHIQMLHIPPEDYAQDGGSGSGGVRSGAGRPGKKERAATGGCSTGNPSLDF